MTDVFNTNAGVRQGGILPPLLFILYIDELANDIENTDCSDSFADEAVQSLSILLFADDVPLFPSISFMKFTEKDR